MGQREANFPEKKVKVLVAQSCLTLWDPRASSPPDSSVYGILQARILPFKKPFPSPRDLPNPGIEPGSPALQTDALPSEPHYTAENTELGLLGSLV